MNKENASKLWKIIQEAAEVIERMQIREYGRKINEETRNKRLN